MDLFTLGLVIFLIANILGHRSITKEVAALHRTIRRINKKDS